MHVCGLNTLVKMNVNSSVVWLFDLILKITDAFGFSIISEWSNHLFWFIEKKTELRKSLVTGISETSKNCQFFMKEWAKNRSLERRVSEYFNKD